MKPIANNKEIVMQENDFIVSKTDTAGKITYCNQIFMSIAGYKEAELMGKNHNIIRHPHMRFNTK
jgi:PAS domain S-box-containing protein